MARRATIIPFPGSQGAGPRPSPPTLVEVGRCHGQAETLVVQGLLESEGITAVLRGKLVQSVHPFTVGDQAEVAVLVHAAQAEHARRVLSRRRGRLAR